MHQMRRMASWFVTSALPSVRAHSSGKKGNAREGTGPKNKCTIDDETVDSEEQTGDDNSMLKSNEAKCDSSKTHHLTDSDVPRLTDSEDNSEDEDCEDCVSFTLNALRQIKFDTPTLGVVRPSGVKMESPDGQLSALCDIIMQNDNPNLSTLCNIPDLTDTEDSSYEDSDSEENSDWEEDTDHGNDKKNYAC